MQSSLEGRLASLFKAAPRLSPQAKRSIVEIWPWIALIFGLLQLWAARVLWHWGHTVNNIFDNINSYYGVHLSRVQHLNLFYWISLVVLLADALILLVAFPKLYNRRKSGWNLLFWGALLNFVYGVFSAFNDYGGVGSLLMQFIVSAVVLYFLFQICDQYAKA